MIHDFTQLIWRSHLNLSKILKICSFGSNNLVSLLANELNKDCIASVLELASNCVGHSDILFRVEFIAIFTAVIPISVIRHFFLAFRASKEVYLSLVIIDNALHVARKLKILRLSMP
jgi:hypothetical protein